MARAVVANACTYARTLALADGVPLGLVDGLTLDAPATPEAVERERELLQAHGWCPVFIGHKPADTADTQKGC